MIPAAKCVIAGDGAARDELEKLSARLGVADRVHFLGNRDDARDVIDSMDVFVLVSDSEGMSNAMLEAMARGRPVVSTNVSGADDALAASDDHDAAGIITDFDETSIAHAIEVLRNDAKLRESTGRAAMNRARTQFSRDAMLTAWENFLEPPPQ
jgi:glycosyltransferase involved in cell wall biosynthesis